MYHTNEAAIPLINYFSLLTLNTTQKSSADTPQDTMATRNFAVFPIPFIHTSLICKNIHKPPTKKYSFCFANV